MEGSIDALEPLESMGVLVFVPVLLMSSGYQQRTFPVTEATGEPDGLVQESRQEHVLEGAVRCPGESSTGAL